MLVGIVDCSYFTLCSKSHTDCITVIGMLWSYTEVYTMLVTTDGAISQYHTFMHVYLLLCCLCHLYQCHPQEWSWFPFHLSQYIWSFIQWHTPESLLHNTFISLQYVMDKKSFWFYHNDLNNSPFWFSSS